MDWQAFSNWWSKPFSTDASATGWFLFFGFVMITIFLWTRILREAGHVAESL